jgi:hypothetical protein
MVIVTITESAIRTGGAPAVGLLSTGSAQPTTTERRARTTHTPGVVVGVLALSVTQVAGAVEALRTMSDSPVVMVAPLVMAAAALTRLRMPMPGPAIHDRQLDLIISLGAGLTACVLIVTQMAGSGRELALLALAPTAVAVLGALVGTRRLWHLRAVPALLVLAWPGPWAGILTHSGSGARLSVLLGVGVLAVAIAFFCARSSAAHLTAPRAFTPAVQL